MLRPLLVHAAENEWLAHQVTTRRVTRSLAERFIAGVSLEAGLQAAERLAAEGRLVTLDHVGEHVHDESGARAAAKTYLRTIHEIGARRLPAGVSVKPTQLGLHISLALCEELLTEIAAAAAPVHAHVTLDMEDHTVTERTVELVERMQEGGYAHVGCAVQSYLHRAYPDVQRLSRAGASVRLCKGAYAEPEHLAYQRPGDVVRSFLRCAGWLLNHGTYPRIATHDHRLVAAVKHAAADAQRAREDFEFQTLYGVRPEMQEALVNDGYRLRVYVPFGAEWYAYFMRRLAERPANLLFFMRAVRSAG